jgi:hypothetical protein
MVKFYTTWKEQSKPEESFWQLLHTGYQAQKSSQPAEAEKQLAKVYAKLASQCTVNIYKK